MSSLAYSVNLVRGFAGRLGENKHKPKQVGWQLFASHLRYENLIEAVGEGGRRRIMA